jgi:DNA-binding CsgD family transcriptional regulator/tetratricopeptide (TPR) repeat protein
VARLVGRQAEFALLTTALDDAASGPGRVLLLGGEAGIGKSRLVIETVAQARDRGFAALEGAAYPLHAALAYAPIFEALGQYLAALPDRDFAAVVAGLPDLGRLLVDPRLPAPPPDDNPRGRMFDAVGKVLHRLAARQPVLLVVEDLHWADAGTVELMRSIAESVPDHCVLLGTYRSVEAPDLPGDQIILPPLSDAEVAELVGSLQAEPAAELVASVVKRAKGIPLFVTTLVNDPRGSAVPRIVRDVVVDRLAHLAAGERRLLELVAVAGDAGIPDVLRTAWPERDFDAVLGKLIVGGLVSKRTGRYQVAHPLYAEVAYSELTVAERRATHAAVAAAIGALDGENVVALAPHYRDAGDLVPPDRTVDVLTAAGQRALAVGASTEAIDFFGAALQAARAAGRAAATVPALDGLARAHQGAGDLERAEAYLAEGIAAAREHSPRHVELLRNRMALLASELGAAPPRAETRSTDDTTATLIRLIPVLRRGNADELRAQIEPVPVPPPAGAEPAERAIAHILRLLRASADMNYATALAEARDADRAVRDLRLQSAENDPTLLLFALGVRRALVPLLMLAGDLATAEDQARIAGGQVLLDVPSERSMAQEWISTIHYVTGRLPEAVRENQLGLTYARENGITRSVDRGLRIRAFLLAEQGKSAEAARCLAEAEECETTDEPTPAVLTELAATALAVHSGQPEKAPPISASILLPEPVFMCLRLVTGGYAAVEGKDLAVAEATARSLSDLGRTAPFIDALAVRQSGVCAVLAGDRVRGQELLRTAADKLDQMGAHLLAAQATLDWAELTEDAEAIPAILTVFAAAEAIPWLDRTRRLARRLGVPVPTTRDRGALTDREAQIARLVADGLRNREIAARIFLSERTVEAHLNNIYLKLGITGRVALARWAAEN